MSSLFPNQYYNNNLTGQLVNVSMLVERPCPLLPPVIVSYLYGSPTGWNAVLVGLLSSILAIIFLLTCLYYLAFRRRYIKETSDSPSPVALIDKNTRSIPVTSSSQTATTTFINEPGKEMKTNIFTEHKSSSTGNGDFVVGMPTLGNGHTNGLLANGITDPSELRLLQHEHH